MRAFFIILFSIFFLKISGFSQLPSSDTLKITIQEAEDRFLRKNLGLVIQHFNIENAEAQLITAHLFQNPQFNFSGILYNPTTKRILGFHQGDSIAANNGEYALGISQLFFTARKRNKNIQLANAVIQQNTYQFYELLRTLRYTLRNDFFYLLSTAIKERICQGNKFIATNS